jgi:hypothetical protein
VKCGGTVSGYTQTQVAYGDDGISMKKISKVRVNTEFRIKLKPKPKEDWEDVLVTAKGITAKSDANADWIDGNGRANNLPNGWFVAGCVPAVEKGTKYKFDLKVEDLGLLDPRIEVVE